MRDHRDQWSRLYKFPFDYFPLFLRVSASPWLKTELMFLLNLENQRPRGGEFSCQAVN